MLSILNDDDEQWLQALESLSFHHGGSVPARKQWAELERPCHKRSLHLDWFLAHQRELLTTE